jgi:hypothetical protein
VAPRPAANARALAAARADSARRALRSAVAVAAGEQPAPGLAVGDTLRAVPRDSVAGAVYAAGTLQGNVRRFAVRGRAGTEGLVALGSQVRRARVAYAGFDVGTPAATFAAAVAGDSLVAGGFTLDSVDVRATYRQAPGSAAQGTALASVYQDEGRSYSVRGDYGLYADRTELRFADLRLRFDTTVYRSTRPARCASAPAASRSTRSSWSTASAAASPSTGGSPSAATPTCGRRSRTSRWPTCSACSRATWRSAAAPRSTRG